LGELVAAYVNAAGQFSDALRPYVGRVGHESLVGDHDFLQLLRDAGRDPVMQRAQDELFERAYFDPAMSWADHNGFTLPLSALVIYDSFIHSGSILSVIRAMFSERTPAGGGDEQAWVRAYVAARHRWLASNVRAIVRHTTYRTACLQREIDRDNWDLSLVPIVANGVAVRPAA